METGSAVKRQRRPAGNAAEPVAPPKILTPDRLDLFKTHLSVLIDRQPSVTTEEIIKYMNEQDASFTEDDIRMALAQMQDENQIMLAGEIVIRI